MNQVTSDMAKAIKECVRWEIDLAMGNHKSKHHTPPAVPQAEGETFQVGDIVERISSNAKDLSYGALCRVIEVLPFGGVNIETRNGTIHYGCHIKNFELLFPREPSK